MHGEACCGCGCLCQYYNGRSVNMSLVKSENLIKPTLPPMQAKACSLQGAQWLAAHVRAAYRTAAARRLRSIAPTLLGPTPLP